MFLLLKMKAGDLWSIKGDCKKAIESWTVLSEKKSFLKDEATLKVGLCHQKMGAFDQAKIWYQKLTLAASSDKEPQSESPSALSAKKFLRYLQFQEKMPKPAEQNVKQNSAPFNKES